MTLVAKAKRRRNAMTTCPGSQPVKLTTLSRFENQQSLMERAICSLLAMQTMINKINLCWMETTLIA
jgi:hypothetical protein